MRTYYARRILEQIRQIRSLAASSSILGYVDKEPEIKECLADIRLSAERIKDWQPRTKGDETKCIADMRKVGITGSLEDAVSEIDNPALEKWFSRMAGEENTSLKIEARQRRQIYDNHGISIRQISTKSYYAFAAIAVLAVNITIPLAVSTNWWFLLPGATMLISALPFIRAGMGTFEHTDSAVRYGKTHGTTEYEIMINSRTETKTNMADIKRTADKARKSLDFALAWFYVWTAISLSCFSSVITASIIS